jgi:hypothetical protein
MRSRSGPLPRSYFYRILDHGTSIDGVDGESVMAKLRHRAPRVVVAACVAFACAAEEDGREPTASSSIGSLSASSTITATDGEETDTLEPTGDSDPSAPSGTDAAETGMSSATTPVFDLGSADGESGTMEQGCQRVDFLFVIDNSVSMEDNQASLVGAFPGFIAAIQATLEAGSDYHIMVADTDPWGRCDTVNGFQGIDPNSNTCNNYINTTAFMPCDAVVGAGVVHPAGEFASNMPCNFMGGNRYVLPTEPDLAGAFACAATVGTAGNSSERPMEGMIGAISPELNAMGACNAGFLRDDALLVIAFVSDDPNYEDTGTPMEWYQAVLAAKMGDPNAVVVLGLTPAWDACPGNGNPKGEHWKEFIEMWGERGIHGSVCGTAQEYVQFFESAVATIDQACDDYVPPG